ncbi:MAG: prepilin-type N-terminal cleavage/methylation domain-containing protein [Akkermansia sp.]|nr:prepilin-type N-terminal cleavage/methylation domain-containing protein [Akkermansia sp.]
MKTTFAYKNKKGFTLIELLVVIAILAVLAGVSYPIITGFMDSGPKSVANKACKDIVAGVQSYKEDHNGKLPVEDAIYDDSNSDTVVLTTNGKDDALLISILVNSGDGKDYNEKNKPYLKAETAEGPFEGLYVGEDGGVGFYDPWGQPYYVFLNLTGEGELVDPFTNTKLINQFCIAYSTGKDTLGKHHDATVGSKAPKGKKGKKNKKSKKDKDSETEPLKYPDYTEEEQEQIGDNVYSWKTVEE